MKKLLITGFDPFGGEKTNPSWEAVKLLDDRIGEYALNRLMLPTVFGKAAQMLLHTAEELQPDVILSIGQAGGRKGITPEVIAINLREASIPDNEGNQPVDLPIAKDGPAAYFATVPVRKMVAAMEAESLPCCLSYTAGAFVCNDVFYSALHRFSATQTRAGFIHVPFLPEQTDSSVPSLSLSETIRGLTLCIKALS